MGLAARAPASEMNRCLEGATAGEQLHSLGLNTSRMTSMAQARIIRLLDHRRTDRGMTVFNELRRRLRRGDIHGLVTTDEASLGPGSRVHRIGLIGFAEFSTPAVVAADDDVSIGGRLIGKIAGFDACQDADHCNILVKTSSLLTADDLMLRVGDAVSITPGLAASKSAAAGILPSVIIGFGHAGRMHGRCIAKARERLAGHEAVDSVPIFVVDTAPDGDLPDTLPEYRMVWGLHELPPDVREQAVAHVCTPPGVRAEVIQGALAAGIRRFIVEKPLASGPDEMFRLAALRTAYRPDLLVVSNWTASRLTREIQVIIEQRRSDVTSIDIRQRKCRISRSTTDRGHVSAFEVEMPHMVSLAQMLAGPGLAVRDARVWDMVVGGRIIPEMGGAELSLDQGNGLTIEIHSDHLAPVLERVVCVQFRDGGRLEGYYPCTSLDHYSQLKGYDNNGELVIHEYIEDDTLAQFFVEAYAHFLGRGARPLSDFEFNARVCELLHEARCLSARRSQPQRALHPSPLR